MRVGSLFSGYAGLDLAVEQVFGAEPAWFVEYDAAPSKILAHHYPSVPNYGDVTTVDWEGVRPIHILTGGYPCQPFSAAGQRKGTDDERHLWPYVREAIRVLRPRFAILENVAGHRSLGLDRVLGDMAEDGMRVWWTSIRASDVGAPHHRERVFILAEPADAQRGGWERRSAQLDGTPVDLAGNGDRAFAALRAAAPAVVLPTPTVVNSHGNEYNGRGELLLPGVAVAAAAGDLLPTPTATERGDCQSERDRRSPDIRAVSAHFPDGVSWGKYAPAIHRWEALTRPAPAPTEPNRNGRPRLAAAFPEWMMGLPAGWVTDVPDLSRAEQLKAIGNGVCPPQAVAAIRELLELRRLTMMVGAA